MKDLEVIKRSLVSMGQIINALPGKEFVCEEADTLLILQYRLPECEVKKQLETYNLIFAKQDKVELSDITKSEIAYVKLKILVEAALLDFDAKSFRALIKECKDTIDRNTNIIRLSKTHMISAKDYQKEEIECTIQKNEAFNGALETLISDTEKQIERMPMPLEVEEETFDFAEETKEADESPPEELYKESVIERMQKVLLSGKRHREVEESLKDAEKEESLTKCKEIPYYEKSLVITEVLPCKDFECFCIIKKKENIYFGLTKNIKNKTYDNRDGSLIELTEITEEFLQFMTLDLLTGEYELYAFSEAEKIGLRMYFNFVSKCFEKHIGILLSVAEYLEFKKYYNRLSFEVERLDEEKNKAYYRALPLATQYIDLMDFYDMVQRESKREIVEGIISDETKVYLENLKLIMDHHIVDEKARESLLLLMEQIEFFRDEEHFKKKEEKVSKSETQSVQVLSQGFMPQLPMFSQAAPFIGNMYFTLQCLDENKRVVDEAYFATNNMHQAMEDYQSKEAYIKRFGLVQDGRFVPLLSSDEGGI